VAKSILHTIESNFSGFSKGQKRIASYILEHSDEASFETASKLGRQVGVSESTVVRFAVELGYDGYPSMQRALQEVVRSRLTSAQRIKAAGDMLEGQDVVTAVVQTETERLRRILTETDRKEFDRAVDLVLKAKHIYVMGVRSAAYAAGYLAYYLHLLSDRVTLAQAGTDGALFEQLFRIGPEDVMIGIAFPRYPKAVLNAVRFAKDRGASVIAITDSRLSPLYQGADAALLAAGGMISFIDSMAAPIALCNALLAAVGQKMGTDISAVFSQLEDLWDEYGVFGETEDE